MLLFGCCALLSLRRGLEIFPSQGGTSHAFERYFLATTIWELKAEKPFFSIEETVAKGLRPLLCTANRRPNPVFAPLRTLSAKEALPFYLGNPP